MAAPLPTVKPQYRVTKPTWAALQIVAALLDVSQMLLTATGIGMIGTPVISVAAFMVFIIWFGILRVNYFGGKRASKKMAVVLISAIAELIPAINFFPATSFGVWYIVRSERKADREKAVAATKAQRDQIANYMSSLPG